MHVKDVMSPEVVVATTDTSFKDLVELMLHHDVSGLPVVDAEHRLVGMVTEGDLIRRQVFAHTSEHRALRLLGHLLADREPYVVRRDEGLTAGDLMTQPAVAVGPDDDVSTAGRLLLRHGFKRLPVIDDHTVVGIVARPDLLRIFDRSDDAIAADVTRILANPFVAPEDHTAEVTVTNGVVTLTGTVRVPSDVEVAEAATRHVAGVIEVDNQLTAREPEPTLEGIHVPLVP